MHHTRDDVIIILGQAKITRKLGTFDKMWTIHFQDRSYDNNISSPREILTVQFFVDGLGVLFIIHGFPSSTEFGRENAIPSFRIDTMICTTVYDLAQSIYLLIFTRSKRKQAENVQDS